MFGFLRHWRRCKQRERARISDTEWCATVANLPLLDGLNTAELERLRDVATLFLHQKVLEPAGGLELTPEMGPIIAAQACLPVLHLGLDFYQGWSSVILYPEGFLAHHEYTDPNGLVHNVRRSLIGEAWERGPVILSWANIINALDEPGLNIVIHEMAHKLDMLAGGVNGLPPLHPGMKVQDWSRAFKTAYERLCRDVDRGRPTVLDPYAAESPGEFFAVISEAFFETPTIVNETWPDVYAQLSLFYRQDPQSRRPGKEALPAVSVCPD